MYSSILYFLCLLLTNPANQVDIIAPSSKGKESDLPTIKEYVKTLDFNPHISEKIYSNDNPFYSNSDEFRANDLISALTDDSKIIWCIRGGEGASRLIPYLERLPNDKKERIAQNKNKKILIGYSDITALHIYLQVKYDWQTLHGTMLEMIVNNSVSESSVEKLKELILKQCDSIRFDNLKMINNGIRLKNGRLESKIIGGNMTLVENSIGTAWQINAKDKILFLEDIRVYPYSIERSLDHLKQAHIFDGVHAVIFGDFVNCYNDNLVEVVKERFAKSVNFPVFTMKGVGHGHTNDPLPLNTYTTISMQDEKEGLFFMDFTTVEK
ncbi:peptidase S66 family protein [Wolbachia endosymbiont of Armadillidium vulgare str. wVulC]|uniref:LD-carboxypeptidase n=1 Tax=Wolbachia endosymbiont of Armadillidium vulgare TaxID=77039 RepID=UPI00064B4F6D|nr:LD-carboxypeptidase [Wolbachia endosymbiont of Armadillidium vulgare]KLT21656.1 peptidase S66 family protein [Wolbachia endosymbiont of Armadillidium vulgare str. wVulC]